MLKSVFFRRLFIPYIILICVATAGVGVFAALRVRATYLEDRRQALRDDLQLVAHVIEDDVSASRLEHLNNSISQLGEEIHCRITVIAEDGTVLADNWADASEMENHANRPELLAARGQGEASSTRASATIHQDLMYMARHIRGADGKLYYLRLALPLRRLHEELGVLYWGLSLVAVLAMLGSAAIVYHFARRHTAPVVELSAVADAISRGELERRVVLSGRDRGELRTLGAALNQMADSMHRLLTQARKDKTELLTMLSSMSEGIIATDAQQNILVVNEAAGQLLGFPAEQAGGKPLWQVVRIESLIKAAADSLERGDKRRLELGWIGPRFIDVSLCPYPAAGPRQGMVLVAHDSTQAVRYQELRKEFVANVSHELRTPLSVIRGFVETLRDGALADPQKAEEYLSRIERHTMQLTNLVNDLLELSHLESQADLPRRLSVDVSAAARKSVELLTPAAQAKSQQIQQEIGRLPLLVGDPDFIERAIANLLDNAIKYTPDGGRIRISTSTIDRCAVVEVTDNGIGIPAADIPRIFERFYRVDRSRSREMGGTGLGLAIVKHVAQVHCGTVEVSSTPGEGSTFRIKLPIQTAANV